MDKSFVNRINPGHWRFFLFITFFLVTTGFIQAQLPFIPDHSIELKRDGEVMKNPWAGGFNSPQFSMVDLDGDGKKDLITFDRAFYGVFKAFLNAGSEGQTQFIYAPDYLYKFPRLQNWALMVDYNCDGHEDIFSSVPGGIRVYRNDFTEEKGNHFTLVTNILHAEGLDGQEPIYVSPPDLPAIHDVDGDGDLDILSFEVLGNHVAYFKNMSLENYGNCDHLEFELKNTCWGYFSEDATNNSINLYDTCDVNVPDPEKSGKHAGSTLLAYDHNGDGVTDLLLGDISFNTLTLLTNGGTTSGSIMTAVNYSFPINTTPVEMTVFPAAYRQDLDNDGIKDLLVSPNNPNTSENHNNIWFYKNTGTNDLPVFTFQQENFLQDGMIDFGAGAHVAFFDENADGLMDLFIGNYGYFVEAGVYQSQVALLRNTGTIENPAFEWITDDYSNFSQLNLNGIYPAMGDMDGDGDQDMITGDEDGLLHYFRNNAGPGNPAQFSLSQPNFKGIDVGQAAKPQIIDVNRDGLPDLLVGERSGTINYFENTGTVDNPDFGPNPTNDLFGGIDVMPECCTGFSAPFMVEDSLGNYMLYVGSEQGMLYLYNDIENNLNGDFQPEDSLYLHGLNINPALFDINNDGDLEMAIGEYTGGVTLWEKGIPQGLGTEEKYSGSPVIQIYPNPAKDYINVNLANLTFEKTYQIKVINNIGEPVDASIISKSATGAMLDISALPAGIYFLSIANQVKNATSKFIIHR
ncbi:MAG: T9SS type A sorting domain-containing protein [Bacteroidetes bacterium]|nr:T9SS type A sorting domain-containing protein [Bacteroidota bacterium]